MNLIKSTAMTIPALIVVAAFLLFLRMLWDFQVHFLEPVAAPWFDSAGAMLHIGGWVLLGLSIAATVKPMSHMIVQFIFCVLVFFGPGLMNFYILQGVAPDVGTDTPMLRTVATLVIVGTPWFALAAHWADTFAKRVKTKPAPR
ncbi:MULTISPECIES: hypothetical protein [Achromobacter]|uniref:Uncharacterized protein n=1 Tax=Achromobacter mucicolens TaxID=1389922 RepID=A0ABM8LK67_9BURK|nr:MULTISPECIES: hypothetical protein [Achromobacter]CAB3846979.1 hypothetical protein LMG3410_01568 [Achromobacter aegrifaciens]CAB3913084.1 hypothetical protein LMG3415_05080 [Achromobacter mucicolens]